VRNEATAKVVTKVERQELKVKLENEERMLALP
jgi:hypothetical protein